MGFVKFIRTPVKGWKINVKRFTDLFQQEMFAPVLFIFFNKYFLTTLLLKARAVYLGRIFPFQGQLHQPRDTSRNVFNLLTVFRNQVHYRKFVRQ